MISLYPIWILVFQNDKINGGWFGKGILALTSLVILPFLIKYVMYFVGKRRIEIRRKENVIVFIESFSKENKRLNFDEIHAFKMQEFKYLAMSVYKMNHALILMDNKGNEIHLCASDSQKNIKAIYSQLELDMPRFFSKT